jgi:hypothetical protein
MTNNHHRERKERNTMAISFAPTLYQVLYTWNGNDFQPTGDISNGTISVDVPCGIVSVSVENTTLSNFTNSTSPIQWTNEPSLDLFTWVVSDTQLYIFALNTNASTQPINLRFTLNTSAGSIDPTIALADVG